MTMIGVAIPIPDPYGSMLREKRADFGDPMAETVPSHVTLVPPTEVDDDELEVVCSSLERASATLPPFPMRLRGTGTFRPVSPVVFVAVSQGISYTEMLAKSVRAALDSPEPAFPYHQPRSRVRRAERLRVPVHGQRVRALPPPGGRGLGPAARLPPGAVAAARPGPGTDDERLWQRERPVTLILGPPQRSRGRTTRVCGSASYP
jgi:hypothetical protein